MTGETIRSLGRERQPSDDDDLLGPGEEAEAIASLTGDTRTERVGGGRLLNAHKQAARSPQSPPNDNAVAPCCAVDDLNRNPVLPVADDFPLHRCVFDGDVRRLSSLIRLQNIAQKDVHGRQPSPHHRAP